MLPYQANIHFETNNSITFIMKAVTKLTSIIQLIFSIDTVKVWFVNAVRPSISQLLVCWQGKNISVKELRIIQIFIAGLMQDSQFLFHVKRNRNLYAFTVSCLIPSSRDESLTGNRYF